MLDEFTAQLELYSIRPDGSSPAYAFRESFRALLIYDDVSFSAEIFVGNCAVTPGFVGTVRVAANVPALPDYLRETMRSIRVQDGPLTIGVLTNITKRPPDKS